MVLAIHILATLDVVVQDVACLTVDVDISHRQGIIHTWTITLDAYLIYLWELPHTGDDRLQTRHFGHAEQHVIVVGERQYRLEVTACGNLFWFAAILRYNPDVGAILAVGSKSYLAAVGTPHGVGIVCGIGGELFCSATIYGHSKQVALVRKHYCLTIGRDSAVAHPQWTLLSRNRSRQQTG